MSLGYEPNEETISPFRKIGRRGASRPKTLSTAVSPSVCLIDTITEPQFNLVDRGRIELPISACKAEVIPFNYQPKICMMLSTNPVG